MRGKQINLEDIIITKYKMFLLDAWFYWETARHSYVHTLYTIHQG